MLGEALIDCGRTFRSRAARSTILALVGIIDTMNVTFKSVP